jgi:hypothetical protein
MTWLLVGDDVDAELHIEIELVTGDQLHNYTLGVGK